MKLQRVSTPGKYGRAAVLAVELYRSGKATSPQEAWEQAAAAIFPDSPSSRAKGCPKGAFLGLCSEGLIRGIGPGEYTTSRDNCSYAVRAVHVLEDDPSLAENKARLWSEVMDGEQKRHNSQMDVVTALWTADLIKRNDS
jgi:hypothetical protein